MAVGFGFGFGFGMAVGDETGKPFRSISEELWNTRRANSYNLREEIRL
jgi:hypothetical protein